MCSASRDMYCSYGMARSAMGAYMVVVVVAEVADVGGAAAA